MNKRLYTIVQLLRDERKYLTSKHLANILGVSTRTIKNDISEFNSLFEKQNVYISAKPNYGYKLICEDPNVITAIINQTWDKEDKVPILIPQYAYQRVEYIIKKLLVIDYSMKIDDIIDELFISKSTFYLDLKEIKQRLKRYSLEVETEGNNGIKIQGKEFNKRICIAEYFFYNNHINPFFAEDNLMFNSKQSKNEIKDIKDIIVEVINNYNLHLSDMSIENLTIHIFVMMRRILIDCHIEEQKKNKKIESIEYIAASKILSRLEEIFDLIVHDNEKMYIALHLESKQIGESLCKGKNDKLNVLIKKSFLSINEYFHVDFSQDKELLNYLQLHIPSMIERVKIGLIMRNPLVVKNATNYLYASVITAYFCEFLCSFYNIEIDKNEFGYLVLYFNMSLRRITSKKKYNVILTCGRGRPESITFLNFLIERYGRLVEDIEIVDFHQIRSKNLNEYDLIISTVPLNIDTNIPIVLLRDFNDQEINKIDIEMNKLTFPTINLNSLLNEKYLHVHVNNESLENLLKKTYPELNNDINFEKDIDFVVLDNKIMLLSKQFHVSESHILFIELKKPLIIQGSLIKTILSIQLCKRERKNLNTLCLILSEWIKSEEYVQNFRENSKLQNLVNQLNEIQVNHTSGLGRIITSLY
ncbi:MAG: transcription antiterminator [Erysipelotrichaceae bacterium]